MVINVEEKSNAVAPITQVGLTKLRFVPRNDKKSNIFAGTLLPEGFLIRVTWATVGTTFLNLYFSSPWLCLRRERPVQLSKTQPRDGEVLPTKDGRPDTEIKGTKRYFLLQTTFVIKPFGQSMFFQKCSGGINFILT
jgi:hypothetical protein